MNVIGSLFEVTSLYLLWSTFKFDDKYRLLKVVFASLLSFLFFKFTNDNVGDLTILIVNYAIFIVLTMIIFNTRFPLAFLSMALCHIVIVFYEIMFMFLYNIIAQEILTQEHIGSTVAAIIMFCLVIYVHQTDIWKRVVKQVTQYANRVKVNSKTLWILYALGYYFILMFMWEAYPNFFSENKLFLFSILVLIVFVNYYMFRSNVFLSEKQAMEQYYQKYYPQLISIVEDIRAKQHEYKNHLNTINGIVEVSEDDLRKDLKAYLDSITLSNDDVMIIKGDNLVLNAVVYSKLVEAKSLFINFTYSIANIKEVPLADFELTEILSNLINNAFEHVKDLQDRSVELEVYQESNPKQLCIKISNTGCIDSNMSNLTKRGYSTKNQGRGYGLHNVKKIVEYKKGKLSMAIDRDKTVFEVTIPYNLEKQRNLA